MFWWFISPKAVIVQWLQGQLSVHCMATVYPIGITEGSLKVSLFFVVFMHLTCYEYLHCIHN